MERNYSMMLKQLQMAYMTVTMKEHQSNEEQCIFCWSSGCDCEGKETVKDSVFLNFYEKEDQFLNDELIKYA